MSGPTDDSESAGRGSGGGGALDEIARVLKPDGELGLIWNHDDVDQADWLEAVIDSKRGVAPSPVDGSDPVEALLEADSRFVDVEWVEERWVAEATLDRVLADVLSRSYVSSLEPDDRLGVLTSVRTSIEHLGDTIEYPYRTTAFWARRA